jgi:hypothetical protein
MESIEPTTEEECYTLENKDYLLIKAIRELTNQIKRLTNR